MKTRVGWGGGGFVFSVCCWKKLSLPGLKVYQIIYFNLKKLFKFKLVKPYKHKLHINSASVLVLYRGVKGNCSGKRNNDTHFGALPLSPRFSPLFNKPEMLLIPGATFQSETTSNIDFLRGYCSTNQISKSQICRAPLKIRLPAVEVRKNH